MEKYKNLGGDSNVITYEIGDDFIDVEFNPSPVFRYTNYRYTYGSAGDANVEEMKSLATQGQGLSTFINRVVKNKYSKKW
ncbi:hypothetical protein ACFL08_02870 [Patescibacteria group bacterium]